MSNVSESIEVWRDVPGYEGLYSVSSWGRVRSLIGRRRGLAQGCMRREGYWGHSLNRDGKLKTFRTHMLVALAFLGPRPAGYTVNHKDGNKLNNRASNLEYMTLADNIRHGFAHGLMAVGESMPTSKLTDAAVLDIRNRAAAGESYRVLAREYGVAPSCISTAARGVKWKHVGGPLAENRVRHVTPEQRAKVLELFNQGKTINAIAAELGSGWESVSHWLEQAKDERKGGG
jgi:hypothetical protein